LIQILKALIGRRLGTRTGKGFVVMTGDGPYASLRERVVGERGVVMLIGAADTGKTTLATLLLADAVGANRKIAFVDADIGTPSVGPPACVGLKWVRSHADLGNLATADELRFVGSTHPQGAILPHVVAATDLVEIARREADFIVLDTTGVVSGVVGQTLKYHLMELCNPALVIAMQRGGEMEPTIGMLRRFLAARVAKVVPDGVEPVGPMERAAVRRAAFAQELSDPLPRWRIGHDVFAPTLPEGFDVARLDGMLVGVQDKRGRCLGLGALQLAGGEIAVATRHGEHMHGLRLGSLRIDLETFTSTEVRLRELMFGV
jgi:polynucleotide 5'-kinase involved in rRNA processing